GVSCKCDRTRIGAALSNVIMSLGVSSPHSAAGLRRRDMFDYRMLILILLIAVVIFGTKRLRSVGTDLGAAVRGFKQAMNEGESEERLKQLKQEKDADFAAGA